MDVNGKAVSQWIRAESCEEEPLHPKSNLHPQMRVEEEAGKWEKLWNPEKMPSKEALDELFGWAPPEGFPCGSWLAGWSQGGS